VTLSPENINMSNVERRKTERIMIGFLLSFVDANALPDRKPTRFCPRHLKISNKIPHTTNSTRINTAANSKPRI
jgi:hypothetical protein